jgi:hypothetical protein
MSTVIFTTRLIKRGKTFVLPIDARVRRKLAITLGETVHLCATKERVQPDQKRGKRRLRK